MRVAVVPAKEFTQAKQRLADALPAAARAALARAMLEDVLGALAAGAGRPDVVVTPDAEVASVAERWGAFVVREAEGHGHTAAVARGVALCREWGATVLLTVPGDLPCLTADEVRRSSRLAESAPAAVFVPSRSGVGTNAACLAPPDAVPLRFGEPSFADHLAAARARGIEPVVLRLPGAGLDIDRPEDLETLRRRGPGTRAAAVLGAPDPPPRRARRGIEVFGIRGLPELRPGDDLARLALAARGRPGHAVRARRRRGPQPEGGVQGRGPAGPAGRRHAFGARVEVGRAHKKDPRLIEVILRESRRIVRMDRGVLITETRHGQICANAGVDQSNVGLGWASLLPEDPDASARAFADRVRAEQGVEVAVIVADTFGRPWREGLVNVAIGVAGLRRLQTYLGVPDAHGYTLQATILAVADELAAAAELVMGKLDQVPVAVVRGYRYDPGPGSARELLRDPNLDLFR